MFSTLPKTNFTFSFGFILSSANAFNLDQSKILLFGKELSHILSSTNTLLWYSPKLSYGYKTCKSSALTLYHTIPTFNDLGEKLFENIVGKGENAGNQHFLFFPQCFLLFPKQKKNKNKKKICV